MRSVAWIASALVVGVTTQTCSASFIVNSPNVGGFRTFQDLDTGRVWLDLDNFFNQSYNQMVAQASAAGFTVATRAQVQGLLDGLPLTTPGSWSTYAGIMGSAPNRDLIWGAYSPEIPNQVSWAYSYSTDPSWLYDINTGFGLNDVPNANGPAADMNLWALQDGAPAASTPAPVSGVVIVFGGLVLSAVGRLRRRSAPVC